jgi:dTDP-4-dehydrorhamnose reductase
VEKAQECCPFNQKMKLLVLGKTGQVGSDLIELANEKNINFVALDRSELDLSDIESIKQKILNFQFDYLINCAAYTQVDLAESEVELASKINALAVAEMAAACKEKNSTLVHISTDYVFAGAGAQPYKETDKPDPQSVYGSSKLQGEQFALAINPKTWILRTAWVYGEGGSNFPKTIAKHLLAGKELDVVDDQVGAPTWSKNIAEAILNLIQIKPEYGIFNCTNSGETSWFEFAKEIAKSLNIDQSQIKPSKSSSLKRPAKRPNYSVLSSEKWIEAGLNPLPNWLTAWQNASSKVLKIN